MEVMCEGQGHRSKVKVTMSQNVFLKDLTSCFSRTLHSVFDMRPRGQRSCRSMPNKESKERQVGSQQRQVASFIYYLFIYLSIYQIYQIRNHSSLMASCEREPKMIGMMFWGSALEDNNYWEAQNVCQNGQQLLSWPLCQSFFPIKISCRNCPVTYYFFQFPYGRSSQLVCSLWPGRRLVRKIWAES